MSINSTKQIILYYRGAIAPVIHKMTIPEQGQETVPVTFFTKSSIFVVSERPILVPVSSTPSELSDLVRHLILADGEELSGELSFNFLFESTLLRGALKRTLLEAGWTLERTVRLEYFEASPEPQLQNTVEHPDWIKSISSYGNFVLTGCYDGNVRLFSRDSPDCIANAAKHAMAVSGVAFIPGKTIRVLSASMDQTALALHNEPETKSLETTFELGNETAEPITCIAASRRGEWIATAASSGKIALFAAKRENLDDDEMPVEVVEKPSRKKMRKSPQTQPQKPPRRRNRFILNGAHSAPITALIFDDERAPRLFSASLDGSIRAWDLNEQSFAFILSCDTPITALAHHPTNHKLLLSGHPDGSVRLWDISDPLVSSSSLQPMTFFAGNPEIMKKRLTNLHKGWITGLAWSPRNENLFASTGHDGAVRIWDIRSEPSASVPQFILSPGNSLKDDNNNNNEESTGKILALDWSHDGSIRFGGEDCKLYTYSTK